MKRRFKIVVCSLADTEHAESRRQYGHAFHLPGVICVARAFLDLTVEHSDGVCSHELGHLLAGPDGGEREADLAFFRITGHRIRYKDSKRFGERLEYLDAAGGTALRRHFDLVLRDDSPRKNTDEDLRRLERSDDPADHAALRRERVRRGLRPDVHGDPITRENCEDVRNFEHVTIKNADGTPARARRNGKTQLWKTRPREFRIPCKHGMYDYLDITETNAKDWRVA